MKKIKLKVIGGISKFILFILAVLGFSNACQHLDYYGTPTAKFIVKGQVLSAKDSTPITNIKVMMSNDTIKYYHNFPDYDSTYTDSKGNYVLIFGCEPKPLSISFNIRFKDIDDTLNGKYNELDTVVIFTNPTFTNGDGNWYQGETSKVFNVKLKPKK